MNFDYNKRTEMFVKLIVGELADEAFRQISKKNCRRKIFGNTNYPNENGVPKLK